MLLSPNTAIPQEYGIPLAQENAGIMDNHGIELSIGTTKKLGNGLQISIDGNFTYARNKVIKLYETDVTRNDPRRSRTGRPYNTVFGYQSLGLFTTADDKNSDGFITAADGYNITQFGTLRPGDIKYADLGGPNGTPDGKIDLNDEKSSEDRKHPVLFTALMQLPAGKDLIFLCYSRAQECQALISMAL